MCNLKGCKCNLKGYMYNLQKVKNTKSSHAQESLKLPFHRLMQSEVLNTSPEACFLNLSPES